MTEIKFENGDVYLGCFSETLTHTENDRRNFIKGIIIKGKNRIVYEGEFYHGRELIKGKIYRQDDSSFVPIFVNNSEIYEFNKRMHFYGNCKIYCVNGIIYTGIFSYGFFIDGEIDCVYQENEKEILTKNNLTYYGWKIDENAFVGVMTDLNGTIFKGKFSIDPSWRDYDMKLLTGKIIYSDKNKLDNLSTLTTKNGKITFDDGRIYEGEFLNGKLKKGTIKYGDDSDIITGNFNDNPLNEVVVCDWKRIYMFITDGTIQESSCEITGFFKNGLLSDGHVNHNNGIKFVGKYVYVCHFEGTLKYSSGKEFVGHFDDRSLDC